MLKTKTVILTLFILAFGALSAQEAKLNQTAPEFTLKDSNGKSHNLSDFKGKVVVLEWVNYGCPFVKKHYNSNNMQTLQKKYTEKDVIWLSICSSAPGKQGHFSGEELQDKIAKSKSAHTAYLVDESGTVGKMYGAKTTPHMFVINKDGKLVYAGAIDDIRSTDEDDVPKAKNYVAAALDAVLAGKTVEITETKAYGCSVKYK
jgi:peroxiredoxin